MSKSNTSPRRWGTGVIFSPLHRLVASWITTSNWWEQREQAIIDLFGSARRRTNVMKQPASISTEELVLLSRLIEVDEATLLALCTKNVRLNLSLVIATDDALNEATPMLSTDTKRETNVTHLPECLHAGGCEKSCSNPCPD